MNGAKDKGTRPTERTRLRHFTVIPSAQYQRLTYNLNRPVSNGTDRRFHWRCDPLGCFTLQYSLYVDTAIFLKVYFNSCELLKKRGVSAGPQPQGCYVNNNADSFLLPPSIKGGHTRPCGSSFRSLHTRTVISQTHSNANYLMILAYAVKQVFMPIRLHPVGQQDCWFFFWFSANGRHKQLTQCMCPFLHSGPKRQKSLEKTNKTCPAISLSQRVITVHFWKKNKTKSTNDDQDIVCELVDLILFLFEINISLRDSWKTGFFLYLFTVEGI